jgi:hypothetical protein
MGNMSKTQYSRHWLESLSTSELGKLADDLGIDIPPGLERIFIIEELLLENSNSEDEKSEDNLEINHTYTDPVPLPRQYNISYIEVIIRDPLWVYVFWEIKAHDRELHESSGDFKGYCLRVIPLEEGEDIPKSQKSKENSFTVSIDINDSARYLGFAEQSPQAARRYIIKLGAIRGDAELQIAASEPFNLPRLIENGNAANGIEEDSLIRLSGLQEFSTIRSTDRQSRNKRI